ncbi:MAG TPA: RNA-binding protein [Flavisolibacter sp.]|jgi:RNA recognition motif-containing protein|nr:RNA-binding protein [Flavisolibacter sp.]HZH99492.1 RNA-binding protein [Flavisolibacter sp.]
MNIYVSNLSFNIQDEDLREFFTPFGEVTSAKIIMDKMTNQSRGFGFIEMSDDEASKKAIAELDGASIDGRTIKVMEAKPKEDRPARSNNPFRNNNGGGGNSGGGYNNGNSYNKNRY